MTARLQPAPTVLGPLNAAVRPPGSKSLTNRALIVAALAEGTSQLMGVLDSDDTRVMLASLNRLGVSVRHDPAARTAKVTGCAGLPPAIAADLWLENSGTSIRFLTALCTLGRGQYRLDGNTRMRERPIGPLVAALNQLGAEVTTELANDCPPVNMAANGLPGGNAEVDGGVSSQYLSALLMTAPCAASMVELQIVGELVSRPYVEMTIQVMRQFGAEVIEVPRGFQIVPQRYRGSDYGIEPDASAASYFFAAAAVTGGTVTVEGLGRHSLQGDVHFVDVLEQMGCRVEWQDGAVTVHGGKLSGIDVDMNSISDTAQTLSAVAVFADGPTRIRNIAHVRHKETDRIAAVAAELRRLGITVDEYDDGLTIHPGAITPTTIHTYDDHRMAMSFAVIGLNVPGITIADPGCTAKTYPQFFDDWTAFCGGKSQDKGPPIT